MTAITDPSGYQKRFKYQANHERVEKFDANDHRIKFAYNLHGRLDSITNPKNESHFMEYDPLDRLIKETGFDGQINNYTYDPEENLLSADRSDGSKIVIDYDREYRPGQIKAMDAGGHISRNQYSYDDAGRLIRVENEFDSVR